MNVGLAIFWKDVMIEWRSRDRVVAMLLFALLVVMIFQFSLPGGTSARTQAYAPGLLWVAYVLAALFGLGRAFTLELENDALSGLALAPAERGWVFLGKALANAVILAPAQAATALAFGLEMVESLTDNARVMRCFTSASTPPSPPKARSPDTSSSSCPCCHAATWLSAAAGSPRRLSESS